MKALNNSLWHEGERRVREEQSDVIYLNYFTERSKKCFKKVFKSKYFLKNEPKSWFKKNHFIPWILSSVRSNFPIDALHQYFENFSLTQTQIHCCIGKVFPWNFHNPRTQPHSHQHTLTGRGKRKIERISPFTLSINQTLILECLKAIATEKYQ